MRDPATGQSRAEQSTPQGAPARYLQGLHRRQSVEVQAAAHEHAGTEGSVQDLLSAWGSGQQRADPVSLREQREASFVAVPEVGSRDVAALADSVRADLAPPLSGLAEVSTPRLVVRALHGPAGGCDRGEAARPSAPPVPKLGKRRALG